MKKLTVSEAIVKVESVCGRTGASGWTNTVKINDQSDMTVAEALVIYGHHTLDEVSQWEIEENLEDYCNFCRLFGWIGLTLEDEKTWIH